MEDSQEHIDTLDPSSKFQNHPRLKVISSIEFEEEEVLLSEEDESSKEEDVEKELSRDIEPDGKIGPRKKQGKVKQEAGFIIPDNLHDEQLDQNIITETLVSLKGLVVENKDNHVEDLHKEEYNSTFNSKSLHQASQFFEEINSIEATNTKKVDKWDTYIPTTVKGGFQQIEKDQSL